MTHILSLWLLKPCYDVPDELFIAGLLTETAPMSEAEAQAAFAAATYANQMAEIDHENEPVLLSLDKLDKDSYGIVQQTRTLLPSTEAVLTN